MNILRTLLGAGGKPLAPAQYKQDFVEGHRAHTLLDVRSPMEFRSGHLAGAVNIDVQVLGTRLAELPKDKPIVVYCQSGSRSGRAASALERAGFSEVYDLGGLIGCVRAGLPVR